MIAEDRLPRRLYFSRFRAIVARTIGAREKVPPSARRNSVPVSRRVPCPQSTPDGAVSEPAPSGFTCDGECTGIRDAANDGPEPGLLIKSGS